MSTMDAKLQILILSVFIAHSLADRLTVDELKCIKEKFDKPCNDVCLTKLRLPGAKCCEISQCKRCWSNIGANACGSNVATVFRENMISLDQSWSRENCTDSQKYPSFKCAYHFYKFLFITVPIALIVLLAATIFFIVRRRKRSSIDSIEMISERL